eukprot:COSAG06_NODE_711_length_12877_cov_16.318281_6_plen_250_part_00
MLLRLVLPRLVLLSTCAVLPLRPWTFGTVIKQNTHTRLLHTQNQCTTCSCVYILICMCDDAGRAGATGRGPQQVRKRHLLSAFHMKMIVLPRQARDRHRESTQKRAVALNSPAAPLAPLLQWAAATPVRKAILFARLLCQDRLGTSVRTRVLTRGFCSLVQGQEAQSVLCSLSLYGMQVCLPSFFLVSYHTRAQLFLFLFNYLNRLPLSSSVVLGLVPSLSWQICLVLSALRCAAVCRAMNLICACSGC